MAAIALADLVRVLGSCSLAGLAELLTTYFGFHSLAFVKGLQTNLHLDFNIGRTTPLLVMPTTTALSSESEDIVKRASTSSEKSKIRVKLP
jgi:hypothetical protein